MRTYPEDKDDLKDAERIGAKPWMLEVLKMNPHYVFWGPHEDYMAKDGSGWDIRQFIESWDKFNWRLDELNEVVNFYFHIARDSKDCPNCKGSGYNPETKRISDEWYSFDDVEWIQHSPNRRFNNKAWQYHLTQHEVDALWEKNRFHADFKNKPTAEEVNEWAKEGMGHDAINQWICVQARAEKEGVYGSCPTCEGHGDIFTQDECEMRLTLWVIHPRKGCSRGVEIKHIEENQIKEAVKYLKEAAARNTERFGRLIV